MPQRLTAIVLAAGASRRMGRCKPLLPIDGRPAIEWCLAALIRAGIDEPIVVTGANRDAVAAALRHLPVRLAHNPLPESGMADSLRAGLRAAGSGIRAAMVCLADQPLIAPETFRRLREQHAAMPEKILIPVFAGRRGHPSVFPMRLLGALRDDETLTLRDIIGDNAQSVYEFPVSDRAVVMDMDTPSDYRAMQRLAALSRRDPHVPNPPSFDHQSHRV